MSDPRKPSTWVEWKSGMCEGCQAQCCTLPFQLTQLDLERLGLKEDPGFVRDGKCIHLDSNRKCRIYYNRPDVCRNFPRLSPRPGFCPAKSI